MPMPETRRLRSAVVLAATVLAAACNSGGSSRPKAAPSSSTAAPSSAPVVDWNAVDSAVGRSSDAVALARDLHTALAASATPLTAPPTPPPTTAADLGFDPAAVDRILGRTGTTGGGLQKYGIARGETVTMGGDVHLTPALGVGTVINFQPLGGGKAAIT